MSISQALNAAVAGLRADQSALSLVAGNVANADTPGYIRKTLNQSAQAGSGAGISVQVESIQRQLDTYVQRQLRVESSGAAYADTRAQFYQRLQDVYGTPGSDNSLETIYNNFTNALQSLQASPDDPPTRSQVISSAQALTQQLNSMSNSIQGMRGDAELGINDIVQKANEAMTQIANLNAKIAASSTNDSALATMEDTRDSYIDQLSQFMDISVVKDNQGQVSIFTGSGVQLVGTKASQLSFNAQGTLTPQQQFSTDPSKNGVSSITLTSPYGGSIDLVKSGAIKSGQLGAYLQMRDVDLVQAQNQLDAVAASMTQALSAQTTQGSAVSSPPQSGYSLDISDVQNGNTFQVTYTDSLTSTQKTMTFVRVDDPNALPLSNDATANPNDTVVGLNFSSGMASVLSQIQNALGSTGVQVSNPSVGTLQFLDDGAGNVVDVNSVSKTTNASSLTGGSAALPFFTDGTKIYTGAITSLASEDVGLAQRITVNADLVGDPSKLITYATGTASGDNTRPNFILNQLTSATTTFSANTGIGMASSPFSGTIGTFLRQVISQQGENADAAANLKQGQDVVLSSLQQRFNEASSVNVDEEMTNLLSLQNSYSANARVLSAVRDMLNTLLTMGVQ